MPDKTPELPPDDLKRKLTVASPDKDQTLPHIGLVGDTYTITVTGEDTGGRFCVIDMHIPPGGGPAPHRHDFEETFILLEGEIEETFRGEKSTFRAAKRSIFPRTRPINSITLRPGRLACFASAPHRVRRIFSKRLVYRSPLVRLRRQDSTISNRRNSRRKPWRSPRSIGPNS